MTANINPETGIRYGVVSFNTLAEWVFDEFLEFGANDSYGLALEDYQDENPNASDEDISRFSEVYGEGAEEECYSLETEDGMKLGLSYLGGAPLVWVFQSPYTTHARLCSPCCPNAGDLNSQDPLGVECYTLPPDWFCEDNTIQAVTHGGSYR